jgi:hypothetical protein
MTFDPTSIASRFDEVIVQKPPARRVYSEHSFVTWRAPLRGDDSDSDRGDVTCRSALALERTAGLVGPAVSRPLHAAATANAIREKPIRDIRVSFDLRLSSGRTCA